MTHDQMIVGLVLIATMTFFVWNRWRYDVVAVLSLLVAVGLGVVPEDRMFAGFSHPAVITVAAVLVASKALQQSGVVDHLALYIASVNRGANVQTALTCAMTALLSAFMNNVGALALMMPVALRNAGRANSSPATVLMPVAFSSLLGGLVTLIGTPPNIVIASVRAQSEEKPFGMFDFTAVGLVVACAGLVFIIIAGRYLVPNRQRHTADDDRYRIREYLIKTKVSATSTLVGMDIGQLERLCQNDATVMAIMRGKTRHLAPRGAERLEADDVLMLQGDPLSLQPLIEDCGLVPLDDQGIQPELLTSEDVRLIEAVVMPKASIEGRSMRQLRMHETYGINLLAMARRSQAPEARLTQVRFEVGDVLLLQGHRDLLGKTLAILGCLPLAERGLNPQQAHWSWLPLALFAAAVLMVAVGSVSVPVAFVAAAAAMILSHAIPLREVYSSIEWPVIVLLGSLIPIGEALETTGTTMLIAGGIGSIAVGLPVWGILVLLMAVSMMLSDLIHNTPTAVLMAPIGVGIAHSLGLSVDAVLMAIAVGSASPYLTPIGHQSNTLVMGPGGYQFGDYWRLGLPLDIIIIAVAVPMIMWIWMP